MTRLLVFESQPRNGAELARLADVELSLLTERRKLLPYPLRGGEAGSASEGSGLPFFRRSFFALRITVSASRWSSPQWCTYSSYVPR